MLGAGQAMEHELQKRSKLAGGAKLGNLTEFQVTNLDIAQKLTWAVTGISVHLQEIRSFWAKAFGISGPQWMILTALADLDCGEGVPVNVVSKMLYVDPSFVTTQSKMLEKKGFMRRKTSKADARVVQMSLTDKAYKYIASLAAQQEEVSNFIFGEFSDQELDEFIGKLEALKNRLEKASLKVSMGI
jgi:MarR family transcriptional regulator, organic hydroperoxide resistance regulator